MTLYFAYGSNLDEEQMSRRCPRAVLTHRGHVPGRLVFVDYSPYWGGGVATISAKPGKVPGLFWKIHPDDEYILDGYESSYLRIDDILSGGERVFWYVHPSSRETPPSDKYYDLIASAYAKQGWNLDDLSKAKESAHASHQNTEHKLFVYGTLMKGEPNHKWMRSCQHLKDEIVPGFSLVDCGRFPGATFGDSEIRGEVYEIDEQHLRSLDILEGVPDLYRRIEIQTSSGVAWIYLLVTPDAFPRIPSGSWKEYRHG
jgi:gamma-glutamylcyclotransferase (GGCT)/AIG2-like uncharacterized protein YtfP